MDRLQAAKNQQAANTPGNWSGYSNPQTPSTLDLGAILNFAKQLFGGLTGHASSSPVAAQSNVIGDPSQMKLTYGSGTPQPMQNIPQPVAQASSGGISADQIRQGFEKFAPNTPLATQSGVLAQSLQSLSPQIDPKLILALALKETRGGADLVGRQQGVNNDYNVRYGGKLINYPDLQTALSGGPNPLEGGAQSKGLINMLNGPLYQNYRQSGNLADFFNTYSNPKDNNPPIATQIQQIQQLMKNFQ